MIFNGSYGKNPGIENGTNISLNYTQPVGRDVIFETGVKTELDHINSTSDVYLLNTSWATMILVFHNLQQWIITGLYMRVTFQLHLNYLNCLILKWASVMNIQKQKRIFQTPVILI